MSFISATLNQPAFRGSRMLIQYCVIVSDNHAISDTMQMIPEMPIIRENSSHFFQSKKEIHEKEICGLAI